MRRVLSLKPIVDDAMRMVEKTLHEDLTLNFARNLGADTYARVADIIPAGSQAATARSVPGESGS